jgi:hypothetical protein
MQKEKKDTRYGYYLRVLKFLCKRQNTLIKQKNQSLERLSIRTTSKTWSTLLDEINAYRDKQMKAASFERSLRELKRQGYIEPISENSSRYIVSPKGFKVVGIKEKKAELKEKISLPSRDKTHVNIRCRNCNMVDGYSPENNRCRYCGARLYSIDRI